MFGGQARADFTGTPGNDVIDGTELDDTIDGGAGGDTLNGNGGNDTINGGDGNDHVFASVDYRLWQQSQHIEALRLTGTADLIGFGNGADNTITGNSGDNALTGGGGDDTLGGGAGSDALTGGGGADLFVLRADLAAGDADTITDFGAGEAIRIDGAAGKAIAFTQVGADTEITADSVLVATVLASTSADVEANTTFDAPPGSTTVASAPGVMPIMAMAGSDDFALAPAEADRVFDFSGMTSGTGQQATAIHSTTRLSLGDLFGEDIAPARAPDVAADPAPDPVSAQDPWDHQPGDGALHWFRHGEAEIDLIA